MPTAISANGEIGKRAKRVDGVRRLKNIMQDLKDANRDWATLNAAAKDAAMKKCINAVATLLDYQIEEIKRREGG